MKEISQDQINKRFQALPETLQDAIFSEVITDAIKRICVLREVENKTSDVALLVGYALLGYLRPEGFAAEIQKEAGIDSMKAAQITHDIDTEIFSTVRLELKKLYPPTIQTPTVAAQGFAPRMPEPPAAVRRPEQARPYVVKIPEKFRAKSMWPSHPPEPAPVAAEAPKLIVSEAPAPMPTTEKKEIVASVKEELKPVPPSTPMSDIKPIVPLPTFIQSKFKETLKQTTGEKQTTQEDPALKNAITQFTTPHTAAKQEEEQPQQSIYRETLPEEQKQSFQTQPATQQKAQGKVVDLSGL